MGNVVPVDLNVNIQYQNNLTLPAGRVDVTVREFFKTSVRHT